MTGGQASPLTPQLFHTGTTPYGNIEPRFDTVDLLIAAQVSFVARETVNRPFPLKEVIKKALLHKGFSVVEAISNCHVNLGSKNKMKTALSMTKWIAEKTVTQAQYAEMDEKEREHKYPVGVLKQEDKRLEYTEIYHNVVRAAVEEQRRAEERTK
jgi:2-oxoglutarate ferredoxin oxidoreductase subunit beta